MLDLKDLEKRLDAALSQENEESLSNWLLNQRSKTYASNFEFCEIENFKSITKNVCIENSNRQMSADENSEIILSPESNFAMAA